MSKPKECEQLGHCFYATCHCEPTPVAPVEGEPDAIKMMRERCALRDSLPARQMYMADLNGEREIIAYIDTLTAQRREREAVTEEQVERACEAVALASQTLWPFGDTAMEDRIRARMRTALTAARGGG